MKMLSLIHTSVSAHSSVSRMAQRGWEGRASVNRGTGERAVHSGTGESFIPSGRNSIKPARTTSPRRTKVSAPADLQDRRPGTHQRPTGRPSHTLLCSSNHLYSARMTPATIIKPRSLWIVRSDNSTFVIQLQINPFCSAL